MSWTASLPFKGHFCLETDIFNASLETEYDLFQYTTSIYKGSKHIIRFSPSLYPITGGFGKDSGGHSRIPDLLQAAKSLGNRALLSNGYGLHPSPTKMLQTQMSSQSNAYWNAVISASICLNKEETIPPHWSKALVLTLTVLPPTLEIRRMLVGARVLA
jgi:hypothetical protein